MRDFNQYITFLSCDYVRHFEDSTDVEVTKTSLQIDGYVSEMINYLKEHMEFNPDQRELYKSALLLDESEERELKVLSSPADK